MIGLVNIKVSSIVDTLSPIFFKISTELSPIRVKRVINKVSAMLFWAINIAIPIRFHGQQRLRGKSTEL